MTNSQLVQPASTTWPVAKLRPNPRNPRLQMSDGGLDELAASIRAQGVLQPLLITPKGLVVAGHRRLAAAKLAGLADVPVIERDLSQVEQEEIMLVENLQREDLSPLEEAKAYRRLIDSGITTADVARRIGVTTVHISSRVLLLKLDEQVQWMVHRGDLALTVAIELVKVGDVDRQRRLATRSAARRLTAAELRELVGAGSETLNAPVPARLPLEETASKRRLSPSRVAALEQLRDLGNCTVSLDQLGSVFRETCCACGMESLPTYCADCPMLELVNGVIRQVVKERTGAAA